MSELGQLLKKARIEKGMSLDDLQETTKIRKRYLEAIEDGNYKVLPGNFYVRAFIKNYAEVVGLEPEEVLQLYHNYIPSLNPNPSKEPTRKPRKRANHSDKSSKIASVLLMICFPLLILGVVYFFYADKAKKDENYVERTKITEKSEDHMPDLTVIPPYDDPVPPIEELPPETVSEEPVITYVSSEGVADFYTVSNTDKLIVELEITGRECWFVVKKDDDRGEDIEQKTLVRGDTRIWELDGSVFLHVGQGSSIELKVNGEVVNTGNKPNPKKFQFNLEKVVKDNGLG